MTVRSNPLERVAPYAIRENVLSPSDLAELTAFAIAHEPKFEPSRVSSGDDGVREDGKYRISRGLPARDFLPWRGRMKDVITALVPELTVELGLKPFDPVGYEIELVRHNHGDFFLRHIDTATRDDLAGRRAISILLYFHAEPRGFDGGELRLFSVARDTVFADIVPSQNRLVAFASWIPHEVLPVSCPSRRFADSRFAINCWVRMARPDETAPSNAQA